jgi:hypothetical protein
MSGHDCASIANSDPAVAWLARAPRPAYNRAACTIKAGASGTELSQ